MMLLASSDMGTLAAFVVLSRVGPDNANLGKSHYFTLNEEPFVLKPSDRVCCEEIQES